MKIFLSWSGMLSQKIALAFNEWLPHVVQYSSPYISTKDIQTGSRWMMELGNALNSCNFAIVFVTKDNMKSPWLNFEAGALSKVINEAKVIPLLIDIFPSDLTSPLNQFQSATLVKSDIKRIVKSINNDRSYGLQENIIEKAFEKWFPDLEENICSILKSTPELKSAETESQEETLSERQKVESFIVRNKNILQEQSYLLQKFSEKTEGIESFVAYMLNNNKFEKKESGVNKIWSEYLYEVTKMTPFYARNLSGLKMILTLFKFKYPWVYDAGKDLVDMIESSSPNSEKEAAFDEFEKIITFTFEHPLMFDAHLSSKDEIAVGLNLVSLFERVLAESIRKQNYEQ